ncbi:uncharacterized protein DUF4405 [Rhodovulum imhoffii]|uniref:Uncharacterized protein DUF4405 n=1 Tax=Rhodovulum imhoffii TaxID=365340 RepID=A0A2T5BT09_9RHOB|nr:DUF4405 domain-containing protein [Rhodovulum imhoffii]PTN02528.1 uncharacterized protein DUF4405 [Rhodovulum imhoffii]
MSVLRKIATPLTIGTSIVVGITGVLMFLHAEPPLAELVHEWIGLAFVGMIVLHLIVNNRPLRGHLKHWPGRIAIGLGAVVLAASFLPVVEKNKGPRPDFALLERVEAAPLGTVAALLNENPEDLADRLRAAGYGQADAEATITALSGPERGRKMHLIAAILDTQDG